MQLLTFWQLCLVFEWLYLLKFSHSCDALASILHSKEIFTSQSLHGGLEQCDREQIFEDFKSGIIYIGSIVLL